MLAAVASRSLLISSNGLRKVATSSISSSRAGAGGGGLAAAAWRGLGQQGGGQRPRLLVTLTRSSRPPAGLAPGAGKQSLLPWAGPGGVGGPMRRVSSPLRPPQTRGYFTRGSSVGGEGIVYAIIGANVLVFGAWTWASNSRKWTRFMIDHFTVSAMGILEEGRAHTLFTSMFSHRSFGHLLVNCITLYFFGAEAAMLLGARKFLALYLTGGLASSLCCVAWPYVAPKLDIPASYRVSKWTAALGASGALNAIVAWSILTFPKRMVYVYMVLPVPAALVGVLFLVKDLSGLYSGGGAEANAGHLGGAVIGATYFLMTRGRFGRF